MPSVPCRLCAMYATCELWSCVSLHVLSTIFLFVPYVQRALYILNAMCVGIMYIVCLHALYALYVFGQLCVFRLLPVGNFRIIGRVGAICMSYMLHR